MNFTKYEQRLPVVDPFDFGDKATLENGKWQSIQHEELMIPATNMYIPPKLLSVKKSKGGKKSFKPTPEQVHYQQQLELYGDVCNKQGLMEPVNNRNHNYHYNPFRSNSYAIGQLGNETYMVMPCGDSLTELRMVSMETQSLSLMDEDKYHWIADDGVPQGSLSSAAWIKMDYAILQIRVSTALDVTKSDVDTMIIGVRTIRHTSIFKVVRNRKSLSMDLIHRFDPNLGNYGIRQCHPSHIVLSPYFGYQYAVVGDNGYVVVFDIRRMAPDNPNGVIYERDLQMTDSNKAHSRRWKACVFGPHPKTLIVASSSHAALLDFKTDKMCPEKILYACSYNQRIYCLESLDSRNIFQFCISTKDQIVLLDTRYPHQPIISWKHHFNNNPPTFMELTKDPNSDIVSILAWPLGQDSVIHLQYQYNGTLEFSSENEPPSVKPAIYSRPNFIALDTHKAKFLYLEESIPVIGTATKTGFIRCMETGQSKPLAVIFRLFNDGAVYTQRFVTMDETYPDFDQPPPTRLNQQRRWTLDISSLQQPYQLTPGDGILEIHSKLKQKEHIARHSRYNKWDSSIFFKDIIYNAVTSKLAFEKPGIHLHESNLLKVDLPASMANLTKLSTNLWQLDSQSLEKFDYIIQNHNYSRPKSTIKGSNNCDWIPFPGQDNNMNSAYKAISNSVCNKLEKYSPTQNMNRNKMNHHFASDMYAHLMVYLPVPNITNDTQDTNSNQQFKYLHRKSAFFEPTPSTLLMAHDWNVSDPSINPPDLRRPNTTLDPRRPLFQYHKPLSDQLPALTRRASTSVHSQELCLPPAISSYYCADNSQDLVSMPITMNDDIKSSFTSISTQPSPGTFANRKRRSSDPKKKKKKKVVSGFM